MTEQTPEQSAMQRVQEMIYRYGNDPMKRYAELRQEHSIVETVQMMEKEFPL